MTDSDSGFAFTRPEEGELGLSEAIGQALGAASMCWESMEGTGVFQYRQAVAIHDALLAEVLAQQKRINDRHEVEVSTWKKRLIDETSDLRDHLGARRDIIRHLLSKHWHDQVAESIEGDESDLQILARIDGLIGQSLVDQAKLQDYIAENFPKFGAKDPVSAAIEIMTIFHTHGPAMIKQIWELAFRPAIHSLQSMGIDILPAGTIVYGANPKTKIHRPE